MSMRPPRYLDKTSLNALDALNVRGFSRSIAELEPRKKAVVWQTFWNRAIAYGTDVHLSQLEQVVPDFAPKLRGHNLVLAIASNNTSTLNWLLSCNNFNPGEGLRNGDLTEQETRDLSNACAVAMSGANHSRKPIFNAVSLLIQKHGEVLDNVGNPYLVLHCLNSAYDAGDIDCFCTIWDKSSRLMTNYMDIGRVWLACKLSQDSLPQLVDMLELRKTHADFGRLYARQFPMTYDTVYTPNRYLEIKDTWSYILVSGGSSSADLLTRSDSPMPPRAAKCLDDDQLFKSFLRKMVAAQPTDLAYTLNNNSYIRDRFFAWKSPQGENALHLLLSRMPHYSASPKLGRLTLWLDKNAKEMFKAPFADGTTVDDKIQQIDPLWLARARRSALKEIAARNKVSRPASPKMVM